jgi:hypothetical protein
MAALHRRGLAKRLLDVLACCLLAAGLGSVAQVALDPGTVPSCGQNFHISSRLLVVVALMCHGLFLFLASLGLVGLVLGQKPPLLPVARLVVR